MEKSRLRIHPSITASLRYATQGDKFDYRYATQGDKLGYRFATQGDNAPVMLSSGA